MDAFRSTIADDPANEGVTSTWMTSALYAAFARRSKPSSRRCARCAASTSTSTPASSSRSWARRAAGSRRCSTSSRASTSPTRARSRSRARRSTGRNEDELARMRRRHIGIVFQFFNLLEGMTVLENVVLPAVIAGTKRRAGRDACPRHARPARAERQGARASRRALGWPAAAPRDRPCARERADAAARRRADRRARHRGRPRGARAVQAAARATARRS